MTAEPAPAATVEPLWTVADVMRRLRVSDRYVRRHRAELGGRSLGGVLRFRREDVLAFEDRGRVTPPAPAVTQPTSLDDERQRRGQPLPPHRGPINPVTRKPWGQP